MPRSIHGGRHELGQNFLIHTPTIDAITRITSQTSGDILELGAGDGALTRPLAKLGRTLTAIDIDEHRAQKLRQEFPHVTVKHADALAVPLTAPVVVGNIPFHLTTPILRRLLTRGSWRDAVLLTQWEVARKRCGVGGSTMLTAQSAPWFTFTLHGRVPARGFRPQPSVDGGIMQVSRRSKALVPQDERVAYERFVRAVFTGRGGRIDRIVANAARAGHARAGRATSAAGISSRSLPRDLTPAQWAHVWKELRR